MHLNQKYPYVVLAGYLAREEQWEVFNDEWSEALRLSELDTFHMTDFLAAKVRPYSHWSENDADKNIERFISIITRHRLRGFCLQVSWDDYCELLSVPVQKKIVKHPYVALFDLGVRKLLDRLYWLPSELKEEGLAMFFAKNQYSNRADARYRAIRKTHRAGQFLAEHAVFAQTKDFLPLQAADILANVSRSFVRNKLHQTEWSPKLESCLKRLCSYRAVTFQHITRRMLEDAERDHGQRLTFSR